MSPWWCHSKKADFTFVFYNNKRTRRVSILVAFFWFVEVACFSTLSPYLEECKWDLNNFFSHCIYLTACLCLHVAARFMNLGKVFICFKANLKIAACYSIRTLVWSFKIGGQFFMKNQRRTSGVWYNLFIYINILTAINSFKI